MDGIGGLFNFSFLILFFPLISLCSSFDKAVCFLVEYNRTEHLYKLLKCVRQTLLMFLCT